MEAMHKLADREVKPGRMLDNGGLMPMANEKIVSHELGIEMEAKIALRATVTSINRRTSHNRISASSSR